MLPILSPHILGNAKLPVDAARKRYSGALFIHYHLRNQGGIEA